MNDVWIVIAVAVAIMVLLGIWFWRHQRSLVRRANIMQEAIRNHDLTFQLPTKHMFSGERALQETLNQLGEHIREQVNLGEVESWEKLTRVLTHEIMNATAPIASISQSMLHHPAVKDSDLEEGINAIHNSTPKACATAGKPRRGCQRGDVVIPGGGVAEWPR